MSDVWSRGDAYERFMGRWSREVAPLFLEWLDLPDALRWADVGCGTGALTSSILELTAPDSVLAVDPSEAQIDEARRRVDDPRARFEAGTADDLPAGAFDVAVSGLVLNFVPDPAAAVSAMGRSAPGGVVAAYVWDYAEGMELLRTFWDVAYSLDPSAADLHEGHRFSFAREDLGSLWSDQGLLDVATTELLIPMVFADFDELWTPFLGGQGPAPGYVVSLDEDARERLRATLERVLTPDPTGQILMTARVWAVRGSVPVS